MSTECCRCGTKILDGMTYCLYCADLRGQCSHCGNDLQSDTELKRLQCSACKGN